MNSHFGDGRVDQQQSAQREQNDAANSENAVGGKFRFGRKEGERPNDQHHGGEAGGKQVQSKQRKQNKDNAYRSGQDSPGVVEFDIQRQRTDRQKQKGDVGVHEISEDALFERHAEKNHGLAFEIQCGRLAIKTFETLSLHLPEKS